MNYLTLKVPLCAQLRQFTRLACVSQDGPELAATLRDVTQSAGVPWAQVPPQTP